MVVTSWLGKILWNILVKKVYAMCIMVIGCDIRVIHCTNNKLKYAQVYES